MGVGPFSSESTAKQTTTTVSDQAQLISGKNAVVSQGGSTLINIGKKGTLSITNRITQGTSDEVLTATLDRLGAISADSLDKIAESQKANAEALTALASQQAEVQIVQSGDSSALLEGVLDKITALSESKQTGGESKRDTTILWIVAVAFGAFALILWRR